MKNNKDEVEINFDDEMHWGVGDGSLFRWAVLLAPLGRIQRKYVLDHLRGENFNCRYDQVSRAKKTWQEIGWAWPLYDESTEFKNHHFDRLLSDLNSGNRLVREHAAFAVWTMHAVASVQQRCLKLDLRKLAETTLSLATDTQDRMLQRIAIDLWQALDVAMLIRNAHKLPTALHMFTYDSIIGDAKAVEHLFEPLHTTIKTLLDGGGSSQDLFFLWDLATGLGRALPHVSGLKDQLLHDRSLLNEGGYVLSSILSRVDQTHGLEQFERAHFDSGSSKQPDTNNAIADLLAGSSARPLTMLARRASAIVLQRLPVQSRFEILSAALQDQKESTFVRHSLASCVRASIKDQPTEARRLCPHLIGLLGTSSRARGNRKPIELLHLLLHLVLLLDEQQGELLCEQYARHSDTDPVIRGHALFWLGELHRIRCHPEEMRVMLYPLLDRLTSHQEYAANVATVLAASIPKGQQPLTGAAFGLLPGYNGTLWRTSL